MKAQTKIKNALIILFASAIFAGCEEGEIALNEPIEDEQVETVDTVEAEEREDIPAVDIQEPAETEEEVELSEYTESDEVLSDAKYLEVAQESINIFHDLVNALNSKLDEAVQDPSMLQDEDWIAGYKLIFQPINALGQVFVQLEEEGRVPETMYELHVGVKDSVLLMSEAGDTLITAIENGMDAEMYDKGQELLRQSADKMNGVIDTVDEMQNGLNIDSSEI